MNPSDELKLVLVNTFKNIPRVLFEDSADEFLDSDAIDRIYECDALLNSSPYCQVYEMRNENEEVKGVLWLQIDPVLNALSCRFISVLPEYRDGSVAEKITGFMDALARHVGLEKIFGVTQKNTEYWQSLGWDVAKTKMIIREVE
jgi:hypothetical protein